MRTIKRDEQGEQLNEGRVGNHTEKEKDVCFESERLWKAAEMATTEACERVDRSLERD